MVEVIKAEVEEALAKKFRKKAMEVYGYKKGAMKMALEDLMRRFASRGKADWGALKGVLVSEVSAVELQHRAWRKVD
ncbi:MAG: hypothetical protein HYU39_09935 [Thaumarchaeota archaeon]|nr:hypothetical protein [Nitrososphaerota archaeon]